jgi:CheY-like chemotaxis protein
MFESDFKTFKIVAAQLRRILILDPNPNAVRLLADQMRQSGPVQVQGAGAVEEGLAFVRRPRRGQLERREAPVIMCTAEATAAATAGARDVGAHEFLRKPFNLGNLERCLTAVSLKPRDWIEAVRYVGPDRRRFNLAQYTGPWKRRAASLGGPGRSPRRAGRTRDGNLILRRAERPRSGPPLI